MKQSTNTQSNAVQLALKPFVATLAAMVTLFVLSSCAQIPMFSKQEPTPPPPAPEPEPTLQAQEKPKAKTLWEWNGDGRTVSHIWVDLDSQRVRFYDGSEQIGWSYVASGKKSHPTPVGKFEVMEKDSKKRSNLYGKIYNAGGKVVKSNAKQGKDKIPSGGRFEGAKMPYFMRLTYDGIGLHAGRIPNPGSPASHGCLRMPKQVAPVLYKHVSIGTPVTITGNGPDYGNYAEKQRVARAARVAAERERARADALARQNARVAPSVATTQHGQAVQGAATTQNALAIQYTPAEAHNAAATQEVPVVQQAPAERYPSVVQQAPVEQSPPVVQQAPVGPYPPVIQRTPTAQYSSVVQRVSIPQDTPVARQAPALPSASSARQAPASQGVPVVPETTTIGNAPAMPTGAAASPVQGAEDTRSVGG